jgi:hypothetical protein
LLQFAAHLAAGVPWGSQLADNKRLSSEPTRQRRHPEEMRYLTVRSEIEYPTLTEQKNTRRFPSRALPLVSVAALAAVFATMPAAAQDAPDRYKFRVDGAWWYVSPSGTVNVHGSNADLQKDFNFDSYSSFSGTLDWRFTPRQHLLVSASPSQYSGEGVTDREFVFQGQTIKLGATVNTSLHAISISPGYEFDFLHGDRGHLGFEVLANLLSISADLNATGTIVKPDGTLTASYSGSGSIFAPLPVIGIIGRRYVTRRVYFDGSMNGMYFFGYGSFVSAKAVLGAAIGKHWSVRGGYQLGGRTNIHGTDARVGVDLKQQGPVFGIEGKW